MVRVYTGGIFDIFHYGHGKAFEQIKAAFPNCTLVVGVLSDEAATQIKRTPIFTLEERMKSVKYNKYVDEVIVDIWNPSVTNEDLVKWLVDNKFDFIAHEDVGEKYETFKKVGRFFPITYTSEISTTEIIRRIINRNGAISEIER